MTMPAADKIAAGSRIISSDFDQINRMKAIKNKKAEAVVCCFGLWCLSWRRPTFPHSYPCSIIGPAGLNFRVRDGNGCDPRGMTTRKFGSLAPKNWRTLRITVLIGPSQPNQLANPQELSRRAV